MIVWTNWPREAVSTGALEATRANWTSAAAAAGLAAPGAPSGNKAGRAAATPAATSAEAAMSHRRRDGDRWRSRTRGSTSSRRILSASRARDSAGHRWSRSSASGRKSRSWSMTSFVMLVPLSR